MAGQTAPENARTHGQNLYPPIDIRCLLLFPRQSCWTSLTANPKIAGTFRCSMWTHIAGQPSMLPLTFRYRSCYDVYKDLNKLGIIFCLISEAIRRSSCGSYQKYMARSSCFTITNMPVWIRQRLSDGSFVLFWSVRCPMNSLNRPSH